MLLGFTNAVNFTDGLDGLVGGSATLGFAAFTVIGFWAFRNPELYGIAHALDLAVIAAAMLGACIGFLWWNASPAQIFMGDTGSLAIGAAFATLALSTNTHLLVIFVGGLYVAEAVSVVLQIGSFRLTGRRIFRMAPIHHHFELMGWPETTLIVRFWIIAGVFTAIGLGFFYADFISNTDVFTRVVPN
jgi:phospho-N-acetylmuramoyl-pentapeptide-transferase